MTMVVQNFQWNLNRSGGWRDGGRINHRTATLTIQCYPAIPPAATAMAAERFDLKVETRKSRAGNTEWDYTVLAWEMDPHDILAGESDDRLIEHMTGLVEQVTAYIAEILPIAKGVQAIANRLNRIENGKEQAA